MATPKRVIPPGPEVKRLSKDVSKTTITKLVRDNLISLIRDKISEDKHYNSIVKGYLAWQKTGETPYGFDFTSTSAKVFEGAELVDANRWTQDRLAKTLKISKTVVRRVFDQSPTKGSKSLHLSDVIPLAIAFGVSPGYVLQPNRKQLENNSTLQIEGMLTVPLEVTAHQWFAWVHGMAGLPGKSSKSFEVRMTQLTSYENMEYLKPAEIFTPIEMDRIFEGSYFSPLAATLSAHEWFSPLLAPDVNGRSFLDDAQRKRQPADRDLMVLRSKITFFTHARRALRLMDEFEGDHDTKKAIFWSLNQLGHALAAVAANRPKKLIKDKE